MQGDYDNTVYTDSVITYTFDMVASPNGYDITKIATYMGWVPVGNGRSNQGYQVDLTFADDTTDTLIAQATFEENDPACYWTQVIHTNSGGGIMDNGNDVIATGVKSVTFRNFDAARASGPVMVRELDIFGTATVIPEPSTIILLVTGIFGLLAYAWRKRK